MPLFVLYKNHRNEIAWREVLTMSQPFVALYPPTEALLRDHPQPIGTQAEMGRPLIEAKLAYCVKCVLKDRDAPRNLKMASILAFHEGPRASLPIPEQPEPEQATPQAEPETSDATASAPWDKPRDGDGEILSRVMRIVRNRQRDRISATSFAVADIARLLDIVATPKATPDCTHVPAPSFAAPASLDFFRLRCANMYRQDEWDRTTALHGDLGHLYRANELAGEVGEACNVVKKLVRENLKIIGSRATYDELADELADVIICCDLLAADFDIALGQAVVAKFNETSRQRKLHTRL